MEKLNKIIKETTTAMRELNAVESPTLRKNLEVIIGGKLNAHMINTQVKLDSLDALITRTEKVYKELDHEILNNLEQYRKDMCTISYDSPEYDELSERNADETIMRRRLVNRYYTFVNEILAVKKQVGKDKKCN